MTSSAPFARQVAKCPGAAAILDSGTHMIVYIPGEGAAVKVADGKVEPVEQAASKEVATIEKERAPPKRPEPLTPDEKIANNNKLRDERRFRRNALAREAETNEKVAADATVFTVSGEAKSADEAASEVQDLSWTKFFTDFFQLEKFFGSIRSHIYFVTSLATKFFLSPEKNDYLN